MLRAPLPTTLNYNLAIHSNDSFWIVQKDQASLSAVRLTTPRRPVQTGRLRDRDIAAGWRDLETPCASLSTQAPSRPPTAARKAQVLGLRKRSGRETDSPLEGDGFELPVPRELISAGGRNPAASGSTSALDGATRAQLGGAERTVARKWRKTGIFPPFRDAPRVKSVVWRNQVSSKSMG